MYWSPNFVAVVFKTQEISQHLVTRMQDLASEFSKNCVFQPSLGVEFRDNIRCLPLAHWKARSGLPISVD